MLIALKSFQNVRYFTNTVPLFGQNHYDVLGVASKATQADVKAAYYKLSMVYHPDKNEGCENSATKFRNITAAYEVLGNIQLRKLYDRGISHIRGEKVATEHPTVKFYRAREFKSRPPMTGRTANYDFDEWSRQHYGSTFARDMERKRRAKFYKTVADKKDGDLKFAQFITLFGAFLGSFYYLTSARDDHDTVGFGIKETIIATNKPRQD